VQLNFKFVKHIGYYSIFYIQRFSYFAVIEKQITEDILEINIIYLFYQFLYKIKFSKYFDLF